MAWVPNAMGAKRWSPMWGGLYCQGRENTRGGWEGYLLGQRCGGPTGLRGNKWSQFINSTDGKDVLYSS